MLTLKNVTMAINISNLTGVNFCTFKISFRFADVLLSSLNYLEVGIDGGSYRNAMFGGEPLQRRRGAGFHPCAAGAANRVVHGHKLSLIHRHGSRCRLMSQNSQRTIGQVNINGDCDAPIYTSTMSSFRLKTNAATSSHSCWGTFKAFIVAPA